MKINISNLKKSYPTGNNTMSVFSSLGLGIKDTEILSIVGPNGCGKSTLLNMISNIDNDFTGNIEIEKGASISYMFQDDLLLPWKNSLGNSLLGLGIKRNITVSDIKRAIHFHALFGITDQILQYPYTMSGGERQKTALIRTIMPDADILLLDEPFSAMDFWGKLKIQDWFLRFVKREKKTVIIVTHDIEDAIAISDRVAVFGGKSTDVLNIINIDIASEERDSVRLRQNAKFSYYFASLWKLLSKAGNSSVHVD